jgi:large subunit ribosomal protein L25
MSALAGKIREVTGKSATRKLRSEEAMPAVLYGLKDNLNLTVNPKELNKLLIARGRNALIELKIDGDADRSVVLKEFQSHPLRTGWIHADFLEVDVTKKIRVKVPILLVGTSPGEKQGGLVNQIIRNLEVESIPSNIPEKIEIQMDNIELNEVIHVSDLVIGEGVEIINDPSEAVVTVHVEKVKEEKSEGEEGAEGETADAAEPTDAGKKEDGSK